jgi:hypothetical protein
MAEPLAEPFQGLPSEAVKAGWCPMCMGTGKISPLTMCVHDGPGHAAGDPCELCKGTGTWPPPLPEPVVVPGPENGWSR